jgi:D-alanyl-lipoteichoic acid acyltransferase DltB (MBOAT superfamily)
MLFNSLTFVLFFSVVLAIHSLPIAWKIKKSNLVVASYLFYAAWNPPFVVLLIISTVVDWRVAEWMHRQSGLTRRRLLLCVSLSVNLGLLAYFKYSAFLLDNFSSLMESLGISWKLASPDIILPMGISFYTFQTLSYTLDVYHRRTKPWHSFLDYAMYVSFFPQLVAGPIVRATEFLPQCNQPRQADARAMGLGLALILLGLFMKIVLADAIFAPVADQVYAEVTAATTITAWIGTLAFAGQIFCDFAGYSSCAVGAAMCLGFKIPNNFHMPYAAVGSSDFWRRWHISLSTWLRDYLYIPLGGNRSGEIRVLVNLMITMLLGGLWHGASWNFIIWGGLHGSFLIVERGLKLIPWPNRWVSMLPSQLAFAVLTFFAVCLAWVFFRAASLEDAVSLLMVMLKWSPSTGSLTGSPEMLLALVACMGLFVTHWLMREASTQQWLTRLSWPLRALFLAGIGLMIILTPDDSRAFIYFQF